MQSRSGHHPMPPSIETDPNIIQSLQINAPPSNISSSTSSKCTFRSFFPSQVPKFIWKKPKHPTTKNSFIGRKTSFEKAHTAVFKLLLEFHYFTEDNSDNNTSTSELEIVLYFLEFCSICHTMPTTEAGLSSSLM